MEAYPVAVVVELSVPTTACGLPAIARATSTMTAPGPADTIIWRPSGVKAIPLAPSKSTYGIGSEIWWSRLGANVLVSRTPRVVFNATKALFPCRA